MRKGEAAARNITRLLPFIIDEYKKIPGFENYSQGHIAQRCGIDSTHLSRSKSWENSGVTDEEREVILQKIIDNYQVEIKEDTPSFRPLEEWTSLEALAQKLALNLIDISTPSPEADIPHKTILKDEAILGRRMAPGVRERFILVAGAGASHAATKGSMPLTKDGVKFIRDKITEEVINQLIEDELLRLRQIYKLDPEEFETQLLACSKYSRKEVLEGLKKLCGVRHLPVLSYEIIAHMLKHRLIDIVINFNYDEMLDNVIEEEISHGEFRYIFSDGDCPNEYEELLIQHRLKQPIHIKPHGTISHLSSLRFTREDYFSIPFEIRNTIADLLEGKVDNQQKYLPINLIIIGFSLQSFEFIELIKQYYEKYPDREIKFWFFDKKTSIEEFDLDVEEPYRERIRKNAYFFDLNRHSLEGFLKALWGRIKDMLHEPFRPTNLDRHLLVNAIFDGFQEKIIDQNRKGELAKYYQKRFYVELAIAILRSDGILNANQIVEDRAGKYFRLYKESTGINVNLRNLCLDFGLQIYKGFVSDTFILERPHSFHDKNRLVEHLYEKLARCLGSEYLPEWDDNKEKSIKRFALNISKHNRLMITPDFSNPHKHLFSRLLKEDILNTGLSWIYRYRRMLIENADKWDLLLAISEKGRFLNRGIRKNFFQNKKLELVLASFDLPDQFPDVQDESLAQLDLLSGQPLFLPWWLHNKHMVLFLKKENPGRKSEKWQDNWSIKEGFYYENRMLSKRINPVHIREQPDLKMLLYIFANYWYRARSYTLSEEVPKSVPIIPDQNFIEKQVNELLSKYA